MKEKEEKVGFNSMVYGIKEGGKFIEETTVQNEESDYWKYVFVYPRSQNPRQIKVHPQ